MMSFQKIFKLSFCLFFVKYSLTRVIVINYSEELKRVFTELNISSPTSQEGRFARNLVDERIENEKKKLEAEAAFAKEKERADRAEYNLTVANNKIGGLQSEKVDAIERALKIFVMTHLCTKTELYMDLWNTAISSGTTSPSAGSSTMIPPYVPHPEMDLSDQTRANYHRNAKKMYAILQNSQDPRVIFFKDKVKKLYPHFTDRDIADNFGLGVSLFHNCKHGAVSDDPKLIELITIPGAVKKALQRWKSFSDPVLLDIFEVFQQSIL